MAEQLYGLTEDTKDFLDKMGGKAKLLPPRREAQAHSPRARSAAPHNWIKITNVTPQTINLTGGGT